MVVLHAVVGSEFGDTLRYSHIGNPGYKKRAEWMAVIRAVRTARFTLARLARPAAVIASAVLIGAGAVDDAYASCRRQEGESPRHSIVRHRRDAMRTSRHSGSIRTAGGSPPPICRAIAPRPAAYGCVLRRNPSSRGERMSAPANRASVRS
jgi:hypothetical protein